MKGQADAHFSNGRVFLLYLLKFGGQVLEQVLINWNVLGGEGLAPRLSAREPKPGSAQLTGGRDAADASVSGGQRRAAVR